MQRERAGHDVEAEPACRAPAVDGAGSGAGRVEVGRGQSQHAAARLVAVLVRAPLLGRADDLELHLPVAEIAAIGDHDAAGRERRGGGGRAAPRRRAQHSVPPTGVPPQLEYSASRLGPDEVDRAADVRAALAAVDVDTVASSAGSRA